MELAEDMEAGHWYSVVDITQLPLTVYGPFEVHAAVDMVPEVKT